MNPSPDLLTRMQRFLRADVQGMHAYAVQDSRGLVKLDAMENPFSLPPVLKEELGARLAEAAINRYPAQRAEDLRQALARHVNLPQGCELMLGNGSDELISLLTLAADLPGNCVLAPVPGFVMYEMSAKLQGLKFVGVPLTADFELDRAAMLAAIEVHRPALIWLAYPNNPTANLWNEDDIAAIVAAARARAGDAHPLQVRPGRCSHRLPDGPRRPDRRDRQAAPALQHQRAERRGGALRARTRR
jgi:histidinol-phosphate aminotransferase